ncbi:Transcriptional regulator, PucR family, partial [human gut metagenome]
RYKLNLAHKYHVSGKVFNMDSLMFESIIDNLNEDEKNRIIAKFNEGFERLDNDIIQSIDVFFELNLNLSEASKKLYVHRNTLIYRLDKI